MPTVNVFIQKTDELNKIQSVVPELKTYLAETLTCGDIKLSPEEISVRILNIAGGEMIGNIELEIKVHAFPERVQKQDQICLDVMHWMKEKTALDTKVWLQLSELGHSW